MKMASEALGVLLRMCALDDDENTLLAIQKSLDHATSEARKGEYYSSKQVTLAYAVDACRAILALVELLAGNDNEVAVTCIDCLLERVSRGQALEAHTRMAMAVLMEKKRRQKEYRDELRNKCNTAVRSIGLRRDNHEHLIDEVVLYCRNPLPKEKSSQLPWYQRVVAENSDCFQRQVHHVRLHSRQTCDYYYTSSWSAPADIPQAWRRDLPAQYRPTQ